MLWVLWTPQDWDCSEKLNLSRSEVLLFSESSILPPLQGHAVDWRRTDVSTQYTPRRRHALHVLVENVGDCELGF